MPGTRCLGGLVRQLDKIQLGYNHGPCLYTYVLSGRVHKLGCHKIGRVVDYRLRNILRLTARSEHFDLSSGGRRRNGDRCSLEALQDLI
jgi:hypothetical protein